MNVLFDTNVVLDALLDREPFGSDAAILFDLCEHSIINGLICADSVTTIFYLVRKARDLRFARRTVRLLLEIFEVAPVNRAVLDDALSSGFTDFEDAVVHDSALAVNADGIVTRNPGDFVKSKLAVYSPKDLLAAVSEESG